MYIFTIHNFKKYLPAFQFWTMWNYQTPRKTNKFDFLMLMGPMWCLHTQQQCFQSSSRRAHVSFFTVAFFNPSLLSEGLKIWGGGTQWCGGNNLPPGWYRGNWSSKNWWGGGACALTTPSVPTALSSITAVRDSSHQPHFSPIFARKCSKKTALKSSLNKIILENTHPHAHSPMSIRSKLLQFIYFENATQFWKRDMP